MILWLRVRKSRYRREILENNPIIELFYGIIILEDQKKAMNRERYILPQRPRSIETVLFSDFQFENSIRMSRTSFQKLHTLLQPHIQKGNNQLRDPVPSEHCLAIFLYHIAQGSSYPVISNQFACGVNTVSNIVAQVAQAIAHHLSKSYIQFSTTEQAMSTMEFWRAKYNVPGVVACIDGCHIPIMQPVGTGAAYCNHKNFYSINVQGTNLLIFKRIINCSRC